MDESTKIAMRLRQNTKRGQKHKIIEFKQDVYEHTDKTFVQETTEDPEDIKVIDLRRNDKTESFSNFIAALIKDNLI